MAGSSLISIEYLASFPITPAGSPGRIFFVCTKTAQDACLHPITALALETSEEWMDRRYLTFEGEVAVSNEDGRMAA